MSRRTREWFYDYRAKQVCADCGALERVQVGSGARPTIEFDHLPEYPKGAEINWLLRNASIAVLQEEIAKCEPVCRDCHAERTRLRRRGVQCGGSGHRAHLQLIFAVKEEAS